MNTPGEHYLLAVLVRPTRGKFCVFKAGERVKVTMINRGKCVIERLRYKRPTVPIANSLYDVPTTSLDFDV